MERIEQKGYAAAVPEASGPLWSVGLRLTNQWLHLSAAGVAIGAALFQRIIMVPRLEEAGATPDQIARAIDGFYSLFPWIQLGIFVTTGFFNYLLEKRDAGWTYGPQRDDHLRVHPSLVLWKDLEPGGKDRDWEQVRGLSDFLAKAGFAIIRRRERGQA